MESLPGPPFISAITVAELYAGAREGTERAELEELISAVRIVPVNLEISIRGGLFRRDYKAGHNVSLTDALIAATSEILGAKLVTLNRKHFPMLADVIVPYVKP